MGDAFSVPFILSCMKENTSTKPWKTWVETGLKATTPADRTQTGVDFF